MPSFYTYRRLILLIVAICVVSTWLIMTLLDHKCYIDGPGFNRRLFSGKQRSWPPSRSMLDKIADQNNRLTVVGVNSGFIDMFHAWKHSAFKVGVKNIVVVALDAKTYEDLYDEYHDRLLMPLLANELGGVANWGTDLFNQLTRTRPLFIQAVVNLGYAVFYSDIDTFYRRNPFDEFGAIIEQHPNTSVIVSEEGNPGNWCSCLIYFTGNQESRALLQAWSDECTRDPSHDDQHALGRAMTHLLDQQQLHLYMVSKWTFASGRTIFHEGYDWDHHPQGPVIVHANHLVGYDAKMNALLYPWKWDKALQYETFRK